MAECKGRNFSSIDPFETISAGFNNKNKMKLMHKLENTLGNIL